jgi:prophage tail gpP-like protein
VFFHADIGETKINALQRYLEFTNCLVWSQPNGQLVIGKPNFAQSSSGILSIPGNVIEARVRRAPNLAIRKIAAQPQTTRNASPAAYTLHNQDWDVQAIADSGGGRSVVRLFSYGQGEDAVNQFTQVPTQQGNINSMTASYALREIARENMKVIDVEIVVRDHINENGLAYNIDQMYSVNIPDENLAEDMFVYAVEYELTPETGMITRLRLCRKGSICAGADIINGATQ